MEDQSSSNVSKLVCDGIAQLKTMETHMGEQLIRAKLAVSSEELDCVYKTYNSLKVMMESKLSEVSTLLHLIT